MSDWTTGNYDLGNYNVSPYQQSPVSPDTNSGASLNPSPNQFGAAAGGFAAMAGDFAAANLTEQVYGTNAAVALQNGQQHYLDAIGAAQTAEVNRQKTATEEGMNEQLMERSANMNQASVLASAAARSGDASGVTAGSQVNDLKVQREIQVQANSYKTGQVEANTSQQANLQEFYGNMDQRNGQFQSNLLTWEGKQQANADRMSGMFAGIGGAAALFL